MVSVYRMIDSVFASGHVLTTWDGADVVKFCKCGLGSGVLRIVADDGQVLHNSMNTDAERLNQPRRSPH